MNLRYIFFIRRMSYYVKCKEKRKHKHKQREVVTMINKDDMILAKDRYYSMDTRKTRLNNNVLVVGTSGSGKTRGIVIPNILQASGSYIITDPKGNLYDKYSDYLCEKGYFVKKLNFVDPKDSIKYNFFRYIRTTQDVLKIADMIVKSDGGCLRDDPFWDEAASLLYQALIGFLRFHRPESDWNIASIMKLINACTIEGEDCTSRTPTDAIFDEILQHDPRDYSARQYMKYRAAAGKTLRSINITANSKLGVFDTDEIRTMMDSDQTDFPMIGQRKTALFVVVSDTDRSMDPLVNLFFTQAMNELCLYADTKCKDQCLPVPVRFIMDDFATNCKIQNFPRMIASIRSRGISTMLMIQAESQLDACYGDDGRTIIGNCDTYVYLGGNDVETAQNVAVRGDRLLKDILYMPVGKGWIFRRGSQPVLAEGFCPEEYEAELTKELPEQRGPGFAEDGRTGSEVRISGFCRPLFKTGFEKAV